MTPSLWQWKTANWERTRASGALMVTFLFVHFYKCSGSGSWLELPVHFPLEPAHSMSVLTHVVFLLLLGCFSLLLSFLYLKRFMLHVLFMYSSNVAVLGFHAVGWFGEESPKVWCESFFSLYLTLRVRSTDLFCLWIQHFKFQLMIITCVFQCLQIHNPKILSYKIHITDSSSMSHSKELNSWLEE